MPSHIVGLSRRQLALLWAENLSGFQVIGRHHHYHNFHAQIPSNHETLLE